MIHSCCAPIRTDRQGRELLKHGSIDFPIACYHDDLSAQKCDWHWHDELELLVVSEGSAIVSAATHKYHLHTGQGAFINSAILHEVYAASDTACRLHSMTFHPRLVGGSLESIYWQEYLNPLMSDVTLSGLLLQPQTAWQRELLHIIEAVYLVCKNEDPGYEFLVRELLSKAVYLLFTNRPGSPPVPGEKSIRDDRRMKQMLQYIHAHYSEAITITQIASSASISDSEALRCFHNIINTTPIQYVRQYRLQCARRLLASSPEKIVLIAEKCGFWDMSYFSKSFRRLYGCTPSEYRKKLLSTSPPVSL